MIELSDENIKYIKKTYAKKVGHCLKNFRNKANISQTQLAQLTNKDRQYVYKIEAGKVTPNIATLKILLTALDISETVFFTALNETENN